MNKLKVVVLSSCLVLPVITYAAGDPLNWYSAGMYSPIKVNNQGYSIIVSVNADLSCKTATIIHCNGTTSYIAPGQSYTCVTNQSVDWESDSTSPGPTIPAIPTFGTYIVTSSSTQ